MEWWGFEGWFYPSTRQRCVISVTYKSPTRQITRQEPSGYPSGEGKANRGCKISEIKGVKFVLTCSGCCTTSEYEP